MALKLAEHLHRKFIIKKCCYVFERKNHLLIKFDADLKRNSSDDSHKGWLDNSVFAQVSVSKMDCLKNSLVQAVCLYSEL